jgi:hypothetical protein
VLRGVRGVAKAGMTMIIVTHEVLYAREVADRIVFVDVGLSSSKGHSAGCWTIPCTNARGVSCAGSPMRKILPPESDLRNGARKLYMFGGRRGW